MNDSVVSRLAAWAVDQAVRPLGEDAVQGTDESERQALSALGGVARALIDAPDSDWPEQLKTWLGDAPPPPGDLVASTRIELQAGQDVLAACYERIVSGRSRRRLGTFFTPPGVVEFMLDRSEAVLGPPRIVVDPGAGVGAFTVAARRRWPEAEIVAVDLNVVTLGLLAARCRAEQIGGVRLVLNDYLPWIAKDYIKFAGPRLVLGNPPYTRHHEIPAKVKRAAREAVGDLVTSGLAGLSTYFLAATLAAAQPQDAACFLLPGSWIEARYGREVRQRLWEATHRQVEFYAFPPEFDVFPGTRVTAMVLLVGPEEAEQQPVRTRSVSLTGGAVHISEPTDRPRSGPSPDAMGHWLWPRPVPAEPTWVPLKELAGVRRGVATGANRFFFLNDAERAALPPDTTVPAVVRLRHVDGPLLDTEHHDAIGRQGLRRWLLRLDREDLLKHDEVKALLAEGEAERYHLRHLTSTRDPWYCVESVPPPDVLVSTMSKSDLRAVQNQVGAVPSNSMYGVYLNDPGLAAPLTRYLNSEQGQQALQAQGRHYGRGLVKLEPKNLLAVHVPDPETLATEFAEPVPRS